MDHSNAVTKHYLAAENAVDDAWYDLVVREYSYFQGDEVPFGDHPDGKGRELGDIDVGLVDVENRILYVKEVKTGYSGLPYADDQLDRVENHFEQFGWDVIKKKVLER
jgi:hypothetical protein